MHKQFDLSQRISRQRQRGAAMMFAIAIIIAASLLGAAMMRMLRVEQVSVARDVLSTRALLAADSATQRALYQRFVMNTACATINGSTMAFTGVAGLDGCNATLACTELLVPAPSTERYYSIVGTGSCGPTIDRSTRQVEVLAQ